MDRSRVSKSYIRGTGNGGQKINKTNSCVQLVHDNGIVIRCQESRDRTKNEEIAWMRLEEKIKETYKKQYDDQIYQNRFDQVGNSSRSTKKRTYRLKEDIVIDHESGKMCTYRDFSKGKIELLN